MTRPLIAGILLGALALAAARPATALGPSFDCARAQTTIERAVCKSENLKFRDLAMGRLFRRLGARRNAQYRTALARNQATWLGGRDRQCASGEYRCLVRLYDARIKALSEALAKHQGRRSFTGHYVPTRGLGGHLFLIDMGDKRAMAELETVNKSTTHQCTMHMGRAPIEGTVIRWRSPEAKGCVVRIVNQRGALNVSGPPACRYHCGASGFFSGLYKRR